MGFAHILVVDDDAEVGAYIARILSVREHRVSHVTFGQEALLVTRHIKPDLIVLDVVLPDISGFDVCRQLRDLATTEDIPIVMISGSPTACRDCDRADRCGADDYITKPFTSERFLAAIDRYLAAGRLEAHSEPS